MNTKRIQDAEKLVKKGEEHLKTGLFKWSPDIDSAIECFDKGDFPKFSKTFPSLGKNIDSRNFCSYFFHAEIFEITLWSFAGLARRPVFVRLRIFSLYSFQFDARFGLVRSQKFFGLSPRKIWFVARPLSFH